MPGWDLSPRQQKQRGQKETGVDEMKKIFKAIAKKQGTRKEIPKKGKR